MALITCKNLSLGYEGHTILKDINFKLDGGEYLCIIGENGAGKSRLVKGLLRLKKPMGGSIIPGDNLKHKEIKKCFIDIPLKVKEIKNVIDILTSLCIM